MTRLWREGEKIIVDADSEGVPLSLSWNGRMHPVNRIAKRWQVDMFWWEQRVCRTYFKLASETGLLVIIFYDRVGGAWYLQRLYD